MQKGKKQHSTAYRALAVLLSVIILLLSLGVGATASSEEANIIYSNGYKIEKITNPTKGEGDVDGIKCKLPNTVSVPYPQLSVFNPECYRAAAFGAAAGTYAAEGGPYANCGC